MDCSPPGSSVYGSLQARILEWVAISFSWESSQPRDQPHTSCLEGGFFPKILSNTYSFFKANHSILGLFLLQHFQRIQSKFTPWGCKGWINSLMQHFKHWKVMSSSSYNLCTQFLEPHFIWETWVTQNTHMQGLCMIHWVQSHNGFLSVVEGQSISVKQTDE